MVVAPRGERTDERAGSPDCHVENTAQPFTVGSECMYNVQRDKQTKTQSSQSHATKRFLGVHLRGVEVCLADIEDGRLCGKRRRVAFIYELRIEPTKEGNVV